MIYWYVDLKQVHKETTTLMMLLLVASQPLRVRGPDIIASYHPDTIQSLNEWMDHTRWDTVEKDAMLPYQFCSSLAAYQRSSCNSPGWEQDKRWRVMMLWFVGGSRSHSVTSIYDPFVNSWTRPYFATELPLISNATTTTWCNTNIFVIGGLFYNGIASNYTFRFDGATETWQLQDVLVWTKDHFVPARSLHTAVTIRQPLSNCTCQESILVYGGQTLERKCLGDLWEMRCIADSTGRNMFYWIPLQRKDHTKWPQARYDHTAVDYNKTVMYMWGGHNCNLEKSPGIWEYNLTSRMWKSLLHAPSTNTLFAGNHKAFYFKKIDRIVTLNDKLMYFVDSFNGSLHFQIKTRPEKYRFYNRPFTWTPVGDAVITLQGFKNPKSLVMSTAHYVAESDKWQWSSMSDSYSSPLTCRLINAQFVQDSFYLITERNSPTLGNSSIISLWQFDLKLQEWFEMASPFTSPVESTLTSAAFNDFTLVWYNVDARSVQPAARQYLQYQISPLWMYHTTIRRFTLCLEVSHQQEFPVPRTFGTMDDLQNGSLLMFGGLTETGAVNDLWRVDVCDHEEYMPVRKNCVKWVLLKKNGSNITSPSPRHSHAAFVSNGDLFVFGGISSKSSKSAFDVLWKENNTLLNYNPTNEVSPVLTDMWQFQSNTTMWVEVRAKGIIPRFSCIWGVTQVGRKAIFLPRQSQNPGIAYLKSIPSYCLLNVSHFTAVFDVSTSTWSNIADAPPFNPLAVTFLKQYLVVAGMTKFWSRNGGRIDAPVQFAFLNPTCPVGHYTLDWRIDSCKECPKGSYANMGATHCSSCPVGLTTKSSKAAKLSDCVCSNNYCVKGTCTVDVGGYQWRSAVCQCNAGYTGTTCNNPSYFLIGTVTGMLFSVSLLLFLFVTKLIKYRRRNKVVQEELSTAHRVWNIDKDEITLEERIDGDTPGSYGEVYRATYRDMNVAIKHLSEIMLTDQTIKKEFDREVEVMRAIRHPNIVMFFGVGRVERQEGKETISFPFLVIELMNRGTLKKILDLPSIPLSYGDRVGFALGAAKGMQYLHSLSPPRIHRDLKSANLLISHSWEVKVSDFGSARVVRKEGERQRINESNLQRQSRDKDDAVPLLRADLLLTRDTGTILWRAPEIFALGSYGTSADVYSYGIVLWELISRQNPYSDYEFKWIEDVSRAVQRGIRPTIPQTAPVTYVHLMTQCWHSDPDRRPTFTRIVERLVAMSNCLLVSSNTGQEAEIQL